MSSASTDFDQPTQEDLLGRSVLAERVRTLATSDFGDQALRIGVYGGWGSGKTSVLKMVERGAREHDHWVAWVKLWDVENRKDVREKFIQALCKGLEDHGLPQEAVVRARHILNQANKSSPTSSFSTPFWSGLTRAIPAALEVANAAMVAASVGHPSIPVAAKFLELVSRLWARPPAANGASQVRRSVIRPASTGEAINETLVTHDLRRLVVLIDDLDRAPNDVVAEVMMAAPILGCVKGASFVFGFDEAMIGSALKHRNSAFGDDYLDKVIDFPFWLPVPTSAAKFDLARRDVGGLFSSIGPEYPSATLLEGLSLVAEWLPPIPRRLRLFLRTLKTHEPLMRRWGPDYDLRLLVIAQLIRFRWAQLGRVLVAGLDVDAVAAEATTLKDLIAGLSPMVTDAGGRLAHVEYESACARYVGRDPSELRHAVLALKTVASLSSEARRICIELIDIERYYPTLTEYEYSGHEASILSDGVQSTHWRRVLAAQVDKLNRCGFSLHANANCNDNAIRTAFVDGVFGSIHRRLERADATLSASERTKNLDDCVLLVRFLVSMWETDEAIRTVRNLRMTCDVVCSRWGSWRSSAAERDRHTELRELLHRLAHLVPEGIAPDCHLEIGVAGQPASDEMSETRRDAESLLESLRKALVGKVVSACVEQLSSAQDFRSVFLPGNGRCYYFKSGSSPLWDSQDRRVYEVLAAHARPGSTSPAGTEMLYRNCLLLFRNALFAPKLPGGLVEAEFPGKPLYANTDAVAALWDVLVSQPVTPQAGELLERARRAIHERTSLELRAAVVEDHLV